MPKALALTDDDASKKVVDVLVENLREALKSVDLSILLAFTSVALLFVHGMQGDFARDFERSVQAAKQERISTDKKAAAEQKKDEQKKDEQKEAGRSKELEPQRVALPGPLNLEAELLTASTIAIVFYWVFCFRAAFRTRGIRGIAAELGGRQPEVLRASLFFLSLATAGWRSKAATCFGLGALGVASHFMFYWQFYEVLGRYDDYFRNRTVPDALIGAMLQLVPALYLFWELVNSPASGQSKPPG